MTSTTNYQALGEHTAYIAQAKDAAMRLFVGLNNLAAEMRRQADRPGEAPDFARWRAQLGDAEAAQRELAAALARANQAGALCGQPERSVDSLSRYTAGQ